MYFKSLLVFALVLLTVFVTTVGCATPQESTSPGTSNTTDAKTSFEVWAVDQSSTGSY